HARDEPYAYPTAMLRLAPTLSDLPGGYSDDKHAPRRRDLDRRGHTDRRHDQSDPQIGRALAGGCLSQSRDFLTVPAAHPVRSADGVPAARFVPEDRQGHGLSRDRIPARVV